MAVMKRVAEVVTSWPTLGFTFVLAFFLMWWVLSIIVSGLDGTDVDADGDGMSDDFFGKVGHYVGVGSVPLSLGLTVLSFGAWSVSLLASLVFHGRTSSAPIGAAIAVATSILALFAGFGCARKFATTFASVFEFHAGPTRSDGVGAQVKVRTLHVDNNFGEAEVLTGTRANAIVRVRADPGLYKRGDIGVIVDYDAVQNTFAIVPLDQTIVDN
jgi:hypothetical protein